MISRSEVQAAQKRAAELLERAHIVLSPGEQMHIEVADLGLGELERTGAQLITYINTARYCAKEIILFPRQTCPEHRHPDIDGESGKQETFRCRWGAVYLYVDGRPTREISAIVPSGSENYYTVFSEIILRPGEQATIAPNTLHWFQAGDEGAIISEFSSTSRDDADIFTDPRIIRAPRIADD